MIVKGDGDNAISLAFRNGSRIVGLPGTEGTIRGFSAVSLLIVDEAARVPDEMYKAIRPMLAVSNGTPWLMSTPRGKLGFFHETWMNGGEAWERVKVTAEECLRISKEHLKEEGGIGSAVVQAGIHVRVRRRGERSVRHGECDGGIQERHHAAGDPVGGGIGGESL